MESKVVLGGRGNLGIVNTLRRQIIHIVNWELNTSKDEHLVLELLGLLISSVGSEHYRSLAAMEILQCMDNVLKKLVNNETKSSWMLLLNSIGKHNVIFRDYILYCTLFILGNQSKSADLQNLEAKCIHWRLSSNLLYSLYSLVLRDDGVSKEDTVKCMDSFLSEGIVPPASLIELYLSKNSIRSLQLNSNFSVSSNFVTYVFNKLSSVIRRRYGFGALGEESIVCDVSRGDGYDDRDDDDVYIEMLTSSQKDIDGLQFQRVNCNPFKSCVHLTIRSVLRIKQGHLQRDHGFLHYLLFKSIIDSIDVSPWNLDHWKNLHLSLKNFVLFLSRMGVVDATLDSKNALLNLTNRDFLNRDELYFQKLLGYFIPGRDEYESGSKFDTASHSNGSSDSRSSNETINFGIKRSLDLIKDTLIQRQSYFRYFNFRAPNRICASEMVLLRLKIYTLLCVIYKLHDSCYVRGANAASSQTQNSTSTRDLDCHFSEKSVFWNHFLSGNADSVANHNGSGNGDAPPSPSVSNVLLFSVVNVLLDHLSKEDFDVGTQDCFQTHGYSAKDFLLVSRFWHDLESSTVTRSPC